MFMEHLALTYKCHSSIGNSLDLKVMLKEVLITFVEDTNAKDGFFFLLDEQNKSYLYLSYLEDNKLNEDIRIILESNIKGLLFTKIIDFDDDKKLLIIPLNKGVFIILYEDIATVVVGKNQMGQLQFDEWESKENKYIGMIREIEKYIKKEEQKL